METHFSGPVFLATGSDVGVMAGAGVPTDAVTGAGTMGKGSIYVDITNGKLYVNSGAGTKASPAWKIVTSA